MTVLAVGCASALTHSSPAVGAPVGAPCAEASRSPAGRAPAAGQYSSLEELVARIQASTCSFSGIERKAQELGLEEARVFVQIGFVDQPNSRDSNKSWDAEILSGIESYFANDCGMTQEAPHQWARRDQNGFTLKVMLAASSPAGRFDPEFSAQTLKALPERLAQSHYFIYIGHSRYGKGMDFYPWRKFKGSNVVPVYSRKFFEELPDMMLGVAVLGCDSASYSARRGGMEAAERRGLSVYLQEQKAFNLQESVIELQKALGSL